jgi:hypothetical protein
VTLACRFGVVVGFTILFGLTPSPFGATPSRREGDWESFGSKKGHNKPLNTTESALVRMF